MSTFEAAFCEAEEDALRFLIERHGMRAAERRVVDDGTNGTHGYVCYASSDSAVAGVPPRWTVSLAFSPYVLELSLDISDGSGPEYSVDELYRLEGLGEPPGREHDLYEAARDPTVLAQVLERLTATLVRCGRRFFAGDATIWPDLQAQRTRAVEDDDDRRTLASSEIAFQQKDWQRVVRLLKPMAGRLNGAAAARLSYARKKTQGAA